MAGFHRSPEPTPVDLAYAPQRGFRATPVEVLDRSNVLARHGSQAAKRERLGFHLLMIGTEGHGTHIVDYEPVDMAVGTCVRVHPGQVQQFVTEPEFEAAMVVWPVDAHPADPSAPVWFPGSGAAASWQLEGTYFASVLGWVEELRETHLRFDGLPRSHELLRTLLKALLLRMAIAFPESVPDPGKLPQPYLELREHLEAHVSQRPTVAELARALGYSTRTLDRACQAVQDRTAKQVVDERVALEIRRLLTHTDRSLAAIASEFDFSDPSNFSKFVKRHLGSLPGQIRDEAANAFSRHSARPG